MKAEVRIRFGNQRRLDVLEFGESFIDLHIINTALRPGKRNVVFEMARL